MRENRTYGSEGGEAKSLPYPYRWRGGERVHHGIAKRSVLPPLHMSTGAKPVAAKPRLPQSPCSVVSNLFSRVQSGFVPPQFKGLSLYLMVRFSASTASAKLKICFGWPVTSGCRHLPE